MEFTVLDVFRDPNSLLIILDKIFLKVSHSDEPGRDGLVDKRSIASPTERIIMAAYILLNEPSSFLEVFHDNFVCCLDVDSLIGRHLLSESTVFIKRNWGIIRGNNFLGETQFVIVLSESRGTMNNTSTIAISNKISQLDSKASVTSPLLEKVKHRLILKAF